MNIITTNKNFESLLVKLINKYDDIHISVAWASANTNVFKALLENRKKLSTTTIGTHFYQTDPNVLDAFIESESVKFITQPSGVFHPKVYFFSNSEGWEAIIGSANMTAGAMNNNQEMSVHFSSFEQSQPNLKIDILKSITAYFDSASAITTEEANAYRCIWAKNKTKLDRLSDIYGKKTSRKSAIQSTIMRMPWDEFSSLVKKDPYHGINDRLDLLNIIHQGFLSYDKYKDMPLALRKTIAGLPNDLHDHWGWFGSMRGAGVFHSNINNNNPYISDAIQHIDLNKNITRSDYMQFIDCFVKAFPDGRDGIGTASRLLAMKRPDIFVCIDDKNNKSMCKDFGIKITGMTYERYWDELICRIHDSVWWQTNQPKEKSEKEIWKGRAALLDCIFYEHKA
ncbi:phospholipase D family protein [Shewanella sp. 125m-1]